MLVLAVSEDFDELLKDCCLTAVASLSESGGVVIVTVHIAFVLIVAVLRAEDRRAN